MKYLGVSRFNNYNWLPCWVADYIPVAGYYFFYPLCDTGVELVRTAVKQHYPSTTGSLTDGVLADYLTDHRSELLTGATGPSDPAVRLDQLIDYLRSRFRSQYESAE